MCYKKLNFYFSYVRVLAYNNLCRKILGVSRRSSPSDMFVSNGIPNFEAFLQKSIYSFTARLSSSSNKLICAIEQSWIMKSLIWKTWEEKNVPLSQLCSLLLYFWNLYYLISFAFLLSYLVQ